MTATPLPLRFQIGARTLVSIRRTLFRIQLSLADSLDGRLPVLAPLPYQADGYAITSLPEEHGARMAASAGLIAFIRQRYTRHWIDLTRGYGAYLAALSGNTRSSIKRKVKKVSAASGGTLDVRRFRLPDEMAAFHEIARQISQRTYQERLLGSGMPEDAGFVRRMTADAAAGLARGWLLYIAGAPAAYLYCPVHSGVVIYDQVGHDPAFADLSPGAVLQWEALRDLFGEPDLERFDFTEGDGQHKRQFATGGVACVDLLLLRPTLANRVTITALGAFDHAVAAAKRGVSRFGLHDLAKRIRR